MSELRAPDPTLDALRSSDDDHRVVCSDDTSVRGGAVAHRTFGPLSINTPVDRYPHTACGLHRTGVGFRVVQARHARWFAVPCRECFPDAPPPGHVWSRFVMGRQADVEPYEHKSPYLAWQVTS